MVSSGSGVRAASPTVHCPDIAFDEMYVLSKAQLIWLRTPVASTPLGLYYTVSGIFRLVVNVCRATGDFFSYQKQYGLGLHAVPIPKGKKVSVVTQETKKRLYYAVDTIVLGVLAMIPVIGNLAIHVSKWRYASKVNEHYKEQCRVWYKEEFKKFDRSLKKMQHMLRRLKEQDEKQEERIFWRDAALATNIKKLNEVTEQRNFLQRILNEYESSMFSAQQGANG